MKLSPSLQKAFDLLSTTEFKSAQHEFYSDQQLMEKLYSMGLVEKRSNGAHPEFRRKTQKEIIDLMQKK